MDERDRFAALLLILAGACWLWEAWEGRKK
jgi:hypothetical protein